MNILDEVFALYKENYVKIFNVLYPAKGSTGFTERNLSVNFSKAYEKKYPSSVTWFEYQFGTKNNEHFDAIIVNKEKKELVIIESKRFSILSAKMREAGRDIKRMIDTALGCSDEFSRIVNDYDEYTVIGVFLADVWCETKTKCRIYESFRNKTFVTDYKEDIPGIADPHYYVTDFPGIDREYSKTLEKYHLLSLVWKIK